MEDPDTLDRITGLVIPPARATRRALAAAVKEVSDCLGNTPAVCRSSYIHPRVLDRFEQGETIAEHAGPIGPSWPLAS